MKTLACFFLVLFVLAFRSRLSLQLEILALRHQLTVYQRSGARPRLRPADRVLWAWLARAWSGWQEALVLVQPATVIAWQRKRFRDHWARISERKKPGRPLAAARVIGARTDKAALVPKDGPRFA